MIATINYNKKLSLEERVDMFANKLPPNIADEFIEIVELFCDKLDDCFKTIKAQDRKIKKLQGENKNGEQSTKQKRLLGKTSKNL